MNKNRLEAFSDGVIAIIITIMVLELKIPHSPDFSALTEMIPIFLSYILSFIYVGIYWNNHHHMLQAVKRVTGGILWANLFLLFCLSLIPFATAWMGENHFASSPSALYGIVLAICGVAYLILQKTIIHDQGEDSILKRAVGSDWKGKISIIGYLTAIVLSFFNNWFANLIYLAVAMIWLIPDKRIEKTVNDAIGE